MFKVYILVSSLWEEHDIIGVYDSLEKIKDKIYSKIEEYKSESTDKYEYVASEKNYNGEVHYEIRRNKKYNFNDGLINSVCHDNLIIIEKEVN